jgi:hypothetical protein
MYLPVLGRCNFISVSFGLVFTCCRSFSCLVTSFNLKCFSSVQICNLDEIIVANEYTYCREMISASLCASLRVSCQFRLNAQAMAWETWLSFKFILGTRISAPINCMVYACELWNLHSLCYLKASWNVCHVAIKKQGKPAMAFLESI